MSALIAPNWCPPCDCEACKVAGVTERKRPYAECHGRELLKWWLDYERFHFAMRRALKPMPKATPQTDPDGRPL